MSGPALEHVGAELRRIRERSGLSGSEVAREIGWSQSKVSRVETGRFSASISELAELLNYYGVAEEVRAELLAQIARHDGLEGAWVVRAGGAPRRQAAVENIESRVRSLRQYQATAVPGLLQTHAYAKAVVKAMGFENPGSVADHRLERQEAFRARKGHRYEVVLDGRALQRWPGTDEVMIEQLECLIGVDSGVDLRVLQLGAGARAFGMGGFLLYEFDSAPTVVLIESETADTYLSDLPGVKAYGDTFARLQSDSLNRRASKAHLERTLRDLRGGNQKGQG